MIRILAVILAGIVLTATVRASADDVVDVATGEWPPYSSAFLPGNGPQAERVERVLAAAGYRVRFHFLPWNRAYARTVDGEFAATFAWYRNEERDRELLVPETPLGIVAISAYYKKSRFPDGIRADSLADLVAQGLSFVGVRSYWYAKELEALSAEVDYVPEGRMVWRMLEAGRADIAIEAADVARTDVESVLGPGRMADFATAGRVKVDPLYIMFSRKAAIGAELLEAWEAHAGTVR